MFKDNPEATALNAKNKMVDVLLAENIELRNRLSSSGVISDLNTKKTNAVPIETLNAFQQEITNLKSELESREKRLLRLKEVNNIL